MSNSYWREYYHKNKKRKLEHAKKYYKKHRREVITKHKIYNKLHKREKQIRDKEWYEANKRKLNSRAAKRNNKKYHNDVEFKKRSILRSRTRQTLKKDKKCSKCDSTKNLQFHHKDYNNENDVVTLCKKCHLNEHGKEEVIL